jgi:glutamate dehydrogenase
MVRSRACRITRRARFHVNHRSNQVSTTDQSPAVGDDPIVGGLLERIRERFPDERAEPLAEFARAYMRRLPDEQIGSLPAEELFSHVVGIYDFADSRGVAPIAVRAFNPTLSEHGYQTLGTVVEVVTEDAPFLIDSVTELIQDRGLQVFRVLHPVIGIERDERGRIHRVLHARASKARESVEHYELDRRVPEDELPALQARVRRVLEDVRLSVGDFEPMQQKVRHMIDLAKAGSVLYDHDEVSETVAFLEWLLDLNFVFLGYREYELVDTPEGRALAVVPDSGLGILSNPERSGYAKPVPLATIRPDLRERIEGGDLLVISKTNATSTVHRRAKMDYIGVRRVAPDGRITGEARLLGLFTSKAYMEPAGRTPLLHRKLKQILEAEDLFEGSHDHKAVIQLFDSFPKDELFIASTDDIRTQVMGLLGLQEQQHVRLFVRRDLIGRSVSILVALPRDRFNAELRHKLQDLFLGRFHGASIDYHLALGESDPAQIFFTVWISSGAIPDVSFRELEEEVVKLARTWEDELLGELVDRFGPDRGRALAERWGPRFPEYYKSTRMHIVAGDIERLEQLESGEVPFVIGLQNERPGSTGEPLTRLGLYKRDGKVELSSVLPVLEALGLRVVEEVPVRLLGGDGQMFIHDFGVLGPDGKVLDLDACGERIARTVEAVLRGDAQSDWLNRLIVTSSLDHAQVGILRAYRTYWQRVSASFTASYMNDTLAAHPEIASKIVQLFELRFDPDAPTTARQGPADSSEEGAEEALRAEIIRDLEAVGSLDEDRILRGFLALIGATVRTNFYRPNRECLSLKLRSSDVPDMPKPYPLFEIFVYTAEVEAIHLRGGAVARGGIRWSDRREDYRTEVLGLMKAQMTKNAVIVPTGSKGGFVLRRPPDDPSALKEEVRQRYVTFMRGMLDITDNLVGGRVAHPAGVRVHDGDDPYLVVAADKGTAAMSDTANEISEQYGFWLGDAFASGGSAGYDHKALGITARGAWESVKRHFRELGTDVMSESFTAVGIGDMSGDVFGNGMLLSRQLKLVAAFDHRHVFLDPDPDPSSSFDERRRLFDLGAGTTWQSYDASRISEGGGVFPRTAKHVELSPRVREVLGIEATALTPPELISAILRAPVDLLWNGGIGTYVKAAHESDRDVGDRTNDALRVNGKDLRCRAVGEGGNLGFTQRGRIEYAIGGGRINTDFIDNSGGVDCSDHEVNLKILLGLAVERGLLDRTGRDALIHEVAGDVVDHVLYDNFLQAQIVAQEANHSVARLEAYEALMQALEAEGILEREIECLPPTDEMAERVRSGREMPRPELAVLLAYSKRSLSAALLASDLPDSPYLEEDLKGYFPPRVIERFGSLVSGHPLRRELVATIVANDVVNSQGITFVSRLAAETGAEPADIARAYRIARDVTGAVERWESIESLTGRIPPEIQDELLAGVDWLVDTTSRWYLARATGVHLADAIGEAREPFARLSDEIAQIGPPEWREARESAVADLTAQGVPEDVARRHAFQAELVHGPDIIQLSQQAGRSVEEIGTVFFELGGAFRFDWLEAELEKIPASSRWQRWALQAMEDELLLVRRQLAERVLADAGLRTPSEAVRGYLESRPEAYERLMRFMRTLEADGVQDLSALTVAVRQIRALLG